jgi:hypothetical protein
MFIISQRCGARCLDRWADPLSDMMLVNNALKKYNGKLYTVFVWCRTEIFGRLLRLWYRTMWFHKWQAVSRLAQGEWLCLVIRCYEF